MWYLAGVCVVFAPRCMRGPLPPGQNLINTLGTHRLYFGNTRVNLYVCGFTQVPSPDESIMMKILVTRVTHNQYSGNTEIAQCTRTERSVAYFA